MAKDQEALTEVKSEINELIDKLSNHSLQSSELLDILDVLKQVEKQLDSSKNPQSLVIKMINYLRSMAMKGNIHFPKDEESLIIELGAYGQKAGLNGQYMADFSDKSQFYGFAEEIPQH
ncbi:bacteriocin immunity protein [Companilactobacillus ginsenosidimutans]|uniref:Bacteriocin immunity protein n=1 Tax=Companilactobacillus ginsenosidimutans TaxID=1007676 RepID=A0A0H4QII1_9LACO|nr:bacteriocin immunity protein [Companilactobacillus ginsenosidimutans]AKP68239.1 bacteriocin immunity protein [Companilactobacillus ginsenosidimutans]